MSASLLPAIAVNNIVACHTLAQRLAASDVCIVLGVSSVGPFGTRKGCADVLGGLGRAGALCSLAAWGGDQVMGDEML